MSDILMQQGATFAEGQAILGNVLKEIVNTTEAQVGLADEAAKYGFVVDEVTLPNAVITSFIGPEPLQEIDEDGEIPMRRLLQGYEKGYEVKMYGLGTKCSKLFMEWVKKGADIRGAMDSSVQNEINKLTTDVVSLVQGATLTLNTIMAKVFANGGLTDNAYGFGSASPDTRALIATNHIVKKTGATWSNRMAASSTLSAANLQTALGMFKTGIKTSNGYSMRTAKMYTLLVPRALEQTARTILNSNNNQAGMFAGTGSNAALLNQFAFEGNRVELVVVDMLGEPDEAGVTIGNNAMWFVMDKDYALKYKAFRIFKLWNNEIDNYYDKKTKSYYVDITTGYGVDHYQPECIVGYLGD